MKQVLLSACTDEIGGWTIRVDPPHGSQPHHRKHVHVCKRGVSGEYSWNIDGTRHDKHRFPSSDKYIKAAKRHAADALQVSISSLSLLLAIPGGVRVTVRSYAQDDPARSLPVFGGYLKRSMALILLGFENGLVLVIADA